MQVRQHPIDARVRPVRVGELLPDHIGEGGAGPGVDRSDFLRSERVSHVPGAVPGVLHALLQLRADVAHLEGPVRGGSVRRAGMVELDPLHASHRLEQGLTDQAPIVEQALPMDMARGVHCGHPKVPGLVARAAREAVHAAGRGRRGTRSGGGRRGSAGACGVA